MDLITVKNEEEMNALSEVKESQVVHVEENDTYFIYHGDKWYPAEVSDTQEGLQVNVYEINRQIMSQMPALTDEQLEEIKQRIMTWTSSDIYMLYAKDINYFTIFMRGRSDEFNNLADAVVTVLKEISDNTIRAINLSENSQSIEIWVDYHGETIVMYLFDYREGIIRYGE